ncbi:hypothetical protein [Sporosarcina sp. FA9]
MKWLSKVDKSVASKPVIPMGVSPRRFWTVRARMHLATGTIKY